MKNSPSAEHLRAVAMLLLANFFWGLSFPLIKAIMHVESSFNPYAASHKGALGLMQVNPHVWRGFYAVDGLSFRYLHFYGGPRFVQDHPFRWYRRAVRAVKSGRGVVSVGR